MCLCPLPYLKHIERPAFVGLPYGEHVHQVRMGPVHLKHPPLNLWKETHKLKQPHVYGSDPQQG